MIRKSTISLNFANPGKLLQLNGLMDESLRVLNVFVGDLWEAGTFSGKFASLKTETWLSARLQQALSKQALACVKSQRKRHNKTKPEIRKPTLELDSRFLTFDLEGNTFDFWVRLGPGNGTFLNLPSRKHKHLNGLLQDGWTMKKGGRLRRTDRGWFLDVYFEKAAPPTKAEGRAVGVDCGYKKLLVTSDGVTVGGDMEQVYGKITRKQRGSKAYDRALTERDNLTNAAVNELDLDEVSTVVTEDLVSVKKGSKGKIRKSFNNKLQYWSYRKCFSKLQSVCEVRGIAFLKVDPAYTSQTCSSCGHVDRASRKGERFLCTRCGMSLDADFNASKNILMRGVCSPPSEPAVL